MPYGKPRVDHAALLSLLQTLFGAGVSDLHVLSGGNIAEVMAFTAAGSAYVIRFLDAEQGWQFAKESFCQRHFASPQVPVPPIVHTGLLGDLQYAISPQVPGVMSTQLPAGAFRMLLPALLDTLDAIHATDVSAWPGYGVIGADGAGSSASWPESLAGVGQEEPGGYYGRWHHLFDDTFLERALFQRIYDQMLSLFAYCPPERYLVHGDYGFTNLLVHEGKITAVLDWANARYGDFLYDVAWLDAWAPGLGLAAIIRERYIERGLQAPHFAERIQCYRNYIALDAMRFFAANGREESYRWVCDNML